MKRNELLIEFRRMGERYQERCEYLWEDMLGEFQMKHGLDDESMEEIEEAAT